MEVKIHLRTMRFYASHGCYPTEQVVGGRFAVDVVYGYCATGVCESDDVSLAVNYLDVYQSVELEMRLTSHTIEHVAQRIAVALLGKFLQMEWVEVRLEKLSPPLGGDIAGVSATITARR